MHLLRIWTHRHESAHSHYQHALSVSNRSLEVRYQRFGIETRRTNRYFHHSLSIVTKKNSKRSKWDERIYIYRWSLILFNTCRKLEVSVSKNKKPCALTLATLLGIIAGVLSLAAVAMSIYTLVAKTAITTTSKSSSTLFWNFSNKHVIELLSFLATPPTLRWNSTGTTVAGRGV